MKVLEEIRSRLLTNVFCGDCGGETTIVNYSAVVRSGTLVLTGLCKACGGEVARAID